MQLQHELEVALPVAQTWDLLFQVEEIAPCLPGAEARRLDDGTYDIAMRVKLGPLDLKFKGGMAYTESDPIRKTIVIKSRFQESRGQGGASGSTLVSLVDAGSTSKVSLSTDLTITGRVAQMGRGFVGEVSNDLLAQFSHNLAEHLSARRNTEVAPGESATSDVAAAAANNPTGGAEVPKGETDAPVPRGTAARPAQNELSLLPLLWRMLKRRLSTIFGTNSERKET